MTDFIPETETTDRLLAIHRMSEGAIAYLQAQIDLFELVDFYGDAFKLFLNLNPVLVKTLFGFAVAIREEAKQKLEERGIIKK